jgi:4-hydroxy-3-methylbut-2-enyl diphosphate reductase
MTVPWTLCTAMRTEHAALRRGLRELPLLDRGTLLRTGIGPRRASRAAGRIGLAGPALAGPAVAVAGIGGGLSAALRPGDVVVASALIADPAAGWPAPGRPGRLVAPPPPRILPAAELIAAALRRRGLTVHVGPVVSTDRLVDGAARERLAATGALVADLESTALLSGAGGRPTACVRVVADSPPGRLYRPATLGQLRTALRVLPVAAAALAEWASATTVRRVVLATARTGDSRDPAASQQRAVAEVAAGCDVVLVLGSEESAGTHRLAEVARRTGAAAQLADGTGRLDLRWLAGARTVGVAADTMAAQVLIDDVIAALRGLGAHGVASHTSTEEAGLTAAEEVRSP